MHQRGVDIRPIRQMTGEAEFNEVFLTDARVPDRFRVGDVNDGWRVLQTALASERSLMGATRKPSGDDVARPTFEGGADFVALARERKRGDAMARQDVARLYTLRLVNRWTAERARVALEADASLASMGKLAMSPILHSAARLNQRLLGAEAMIWGPDSATAESVNRASMMAFRNSIGGGSDQIQRNIIGERILGLPREPEVDRGVPFREVRKAEATQQFSSAT
jgi:alkylation response protein AidB-like acyl-CoA dehydrogenase